MHARDIGLTAADDSTVLRVAEADDRIIVSADTDFGTLMAVRGSQRPSIILIRRSLDRRASSVVSLLLGNLPALEQSLRLGAIVVFDTERIRIRPLPLL